MIERLGFGYDAVAAREPRILYLSVSGFGQTGPLAERPAMDPVLQAYTGMMSENRGQDGIPHRIPFISIDMSTAIYSFGAVAWTHHPLMPGAIPLPNIIGMAPFQDGQPRTLSPSKGQHGQAILAEHGYSQKEIDSLIETGILLAG